MVGYSISQGAIAEKSIIFLSPLVRFNSTKAATFYSRLITHCLSKCLASAKSVQGHLIKRGLDKHTFLSNCLVAAFFRLGAVSDAFQVFHGSPIKNINSWNIFLGGCFKSGWMESACNLFFKMPERDVVTWNTTIAGFSSSGLVESALKLFSQMEGSGVRPNGFTFSIVLSAVPSLCRGKLVHGRVMRSELNVLNVVLGNSLIDMYGKFGCIEYAFGVFRTMNEWDIVSWNSMIAVCSKSGYWEWALDLFCSMRSLTLLADQYTLSAVITSCANLQELATGKQVFALCTKMGFLSNSIVSSATIDMFANCSRLEDSIQLFEEMPKWDSALCNSMLASYARHGYVEETLQLFVLALGKNIRPTEFTVGSVLNSISCPIFVDHGTQIHCLIVKSGLESNSMTASLLMVSYTNYGSTDCAMRIFQNMACRDIVAWNTIIMGLARNGREREAIQLFEDILRRDLQPDRISLAGVLLACGHAGLVDRGWHIFLSMENKYNVIPGYEHYLYVVEMFCRAGKLTEAMEIVETMPDKPAVSMWCVLLAACRILGDINLAERVAERVIELEPHDPLPYLVLLQKCAARGMWEGVTQVRMIMRDRGVKKVTGCSWIGLKNQSFVFNANQIMYNCGQSIHDMLSLLHWEMRVMGYFPREFSMVGDGREE